MPVVPIINFLRGKTFLPLAFCLSMLPLQTAAAEDPASVTKVVVRPRSGHTRISFQFDRVPNYSLAVLPQGSISLTFRNTVSSPHKKLRHYSDSNIAGVRISTRGEDVRVVIPAKGTPVYRTIWDTEMTRVVIDVGPAVAARTYSELPAGRENIWKGAGELVRNFDPPLKANLPFHPTDRRALLALLSPEETNLVLAGEAALYKGNAAQAKEIFSFFTERETPVRALATYRLGEALYVLQQYSEALEAFRRGERLWPEYMEQNPSMSFYYGDSMVRSGDLPGGRKMLGRMICSVADKYYAPLLLVRLADILSRQGHDQEAVAIYRTVYEHFPKTKAGNHAALKLADRRFPGVTIDTYASLFEEYKKLSVEAGDASIREEALFKAALLQSLYGPADNGLSLVVSYEKRYPRGVFTNIAKSMREELLLIRGRELHEAKDQAGLVALALDHKDYLSRCFTDAEFPLRLDVAFRTAGTIKNQNSLFSDLSSREWAVGVPFMLRRIIDNALSISDYPLAEDKSREFLDRFPKDVAAPAVREILGGLCYRKQDMNGVVAELTPLLGEHRKAISPESHYFLGKALSDTGKWTGAEKAMARFISETRGDGARFPTLADAYYVCASSRVAAGDRKGAIRWLREGLEDALPEQRDQFLYKLGQLCQQAGLHDQARSYWEKSVKEGSDPVWQKLAGECLADVEWRERVEKNVRQQLTSKK
ncbi:tetratricopeptide repeat protein [Geobacter sp. DSM 9736]|uniref:tetratricopeptide repeat protein n=1 Tax=Geobacter sp. DSM 9736 TaxID=1277350 RepID=UPI000B4FDAA7|nr:tetratricopeptide repeat protein [Geobacter sp. DSM 9736]SNB47066.1 Tetratricopeptide repeat-containing protein [Geobacter sp. DSM 9736]